MKEIGDKALESKFVCGLKEEIQIEMRKLNPVGLKAKMTMAQLIEDDQAIQQKVNSTGGGGPTLRTTSGTSGWGSSRSGVSGSNVRSFTFSPNRTSFASSTSITPVHETMVKSNYNAPSQRLIKEEMGAKKEKGLCFKCDGKFSFGHRYKKELQFMFVQGEDMSPDEDTEEVGPKIADQGGEGMPESMTIKMANLSLNPMARFHSPKTVKVMGVIQGREVVVLIEWGGGHPQFYCRRTC